MDKKLSEYEISLIKALLELGIINQDIQMYIAHYRGGNSINPARIAEIKNGTRGANIFPASQEVAKRIMEQYKNSIQNDKELDEILRVGENNFLATQESDRVEFKKSFHRYRDEKLLKFVQGVANKKGGYILFGINEDKQHRGEIIGLEKRVLSFFGVILNK